MSLQTGTLVHAEDDVDELFLVCSVPDGDFSLNGRLRGLRDDDELEAGTIVPELPRSDSVPSDLQVVFELLGRPLLRSSLELPY
jgi:hypothetical protein